MSEFQTAPQSLRIFVTGSCDGLAELLPSLDANEDIELLGASIDVGEAASALTGGHLDAVLHAVLGGQFPKEAYR